MTKIKKIESTANPLYKKLLSLTKSKGIREENQCLVSGAKILAEIVSSPLPENSFWIFTNEEHNLFLAQPELQRVIVPSALFRDLDIVGSHDPLLCIATPTVNPWSGDDPPSASELLCALGDPNNLGSLLRSAKAFGIKNVVLLEECCHPFHPKAIKASSGACFGLSYFKGPSIRHLQNVRKILALDMAGRSVKELSSKGPWRILLGEEGQGLPQNLSSDKVAIPYQGDVESLNATVAASILFYELQFDSVAK